MIHYTLLATTTFPVPTYTPYDVVDSLYSILYVAVVPILMGASSVWAAWWIWNRTKQSIKK